MKKVAILGYGGRGYHYAKMCRQMDKDFQIVAVIDNSEDKRRLAKETAKLDDAQLFSSLDVFLAAPKTADWLFICTQDKDHREHAVSALKKGYHLLLEKPVACTPEDCLEIERTAKELNRQVAVCHVLRYSLFYGILPHPVFSAFTFISGVFEGIFLCHILFIVPRVAKSVAITAKK